MNIYRNRNENCDCDRCGRHNECGYCGGEQWIQGPPGPQGPRGPQGPSGPAGPAGPGTLLNLVDGNAPGSVRGINTPNDYTMGQNAMAVGSSTRATGDNSFAEGSGSIASGISAHAEGNGTTANGNGSHTEGDLTTANGPFSHAEGSNTITKGSASHAEGSQTLASGDYSHAEGTETAASGISSHTEGIRTTANGVASHAEGSDAQAIGDYSHAEGFSTQANSNYSHAEGYESKANGVYSHAESDATTASGIASHAEGSQTLASGDYSHAEGNLSVASGNYSHAQGYSTTADSLYSFAGGLNTSTDGIRGAFVIGSFGGPANTSVGKGDATTKPYGFYLANGTSTVATGLSATILNNGNAYATLWNAGGTDYAEMFETADGNPIEPGYFIALAEGDKVRKANASDKYILGIISGTASVIGNNGLSWKDRYLKDEWGRILLDEEGNQLINPEWDSSKPYVLRSSRPEWATVGLLGQLLVRDNGFCQAGKYCAVNDDGIAVPAETGYPVMKRTGEKQILIMFK